MAHWQWALSAKLRLLLSVTYSHPSSSCEGELVAVVVYSQAEAVSAGESQRLNGQTKMVSNEVNHQSPATVAAKPAASANSTNSTNDPQTSPQSQNASRSTQDDAMVSYVFQRPNDAEYQPYPKSSRWFGNEDANLIDVSVTFLSS